MDTHADVEFDEYYDKVYEQLAAKGPIDLDRDLVVEDYASGMTVDDCVQEFKDDRSE